MALRMYALILLLFLGVEGFSYFPPPRTIHELSFSFDKRGFFGKVTVDIDVVVPPKYRTRSIKDVEVSYDPTSNLEGEVFIIRGSEDYDYATLHFESEADSGRAHASIEVEGSLT
nr:uncharacterized protein LOC106681729 [Halyomorpha halys]